MIFTCHATTALTQYDNAPRLKQNEQNEHDASYLLLRLLATTGVLQRYQEDKSLPCPAGTDQYRRCIQGIFPPAKRVAPQGSFITGLLNHKTTLKMTVVYWTNGGPGGSGIAAGLLMEWGACTYPTLLFKKTLPS